MFNRSTRRSARSIPVRTKVSRLIGSAAVAVLLSACAHAIRPPSTELTDDRGQPWALRKQTGGTVLLFGYTHCADTCPLTLAKLAKALKRTEPTHGAVSIAFVTVDPQRDTPGVLRAYLSKFGTPFIGLTGTPSQVQSVERSFHVWAQKLPSKGGKHDYDEAHSTTIFFIGEGGQIESLHDPTDSVAELSEAMQQLQ